jgi:hypothetical protein
MVDRLRDGDGNPEITQFEIEEGVLPGVDLDLGSDTVISGGDDLAWADEENMYGNDVLVDTDDILVPDDDETLEDELSEAEIADLELRGEL